MQLGLYETALCFLSGRKSLHFLTSSLSSLLIPCLNGHHLPCWLPGLAESLSSDSSGACTLPNSNAVFLLFFLLLFKSMGLSGLFDTTGHFQLENFSSLAFSEVILGGIFPHSLFSLFLVVFSDYSFQSLSLASFPPTVSFISVYPTLPTSSLPQQHPSGCLRTGHSRGFSCQLHSRDTLSSVSCPYCHPVLYSGTVFCLSLYVATSSSS